jgi:glycerol-3-phosphate acyltransferase PlsX
MVGLSIMSSKNLIIALDVMGGDHGPSIVIPAAALALREKPKLTYLLFGDEKLIRAELEKWPNLKRACTIHHTDKVVSNDVKPSVALRTGKDSSMRLAIESVKSGHAGAIVSAGNTGALMAMAKLSLRCLPGIERPALASVMPTKRGSSVVLDLGANILCDADILLQFAIMGAVYARNVRGIENPTVGLLNVGSEEMKGNDQVREAAQMINDLEHFPGKYKGFVEGNDISLGTVDVVVTDGFTGNIALKVTEGVASLMKHFMKESFTSSPLAMLGMILASGAMRKLKAKMDPRLYNGGMFLGLNGICVKSHGGMDEIGFRSAILMAANLVEHGFNDSVAAELHQIASDSAAVPVTIASLENSEV